MAGGNKLLSVSVFLNLFHGSFVFVIIIPEGAVFYLISFSSFCTFLSNHLLSTGILNCFI